jgi:hypothetical protein
MPLTFSTVRLGLFGVLVGISGVVMGIAPRYRGMTWSNVNWNNTTSPVDSSYQDYPLAVGAMSIIVLLPSYVWSRGHRRSVRGAYATRRIIVFLVRNPTTPQLWLELFATFVLAILWMAVGIRVVTLGINNVSCDFYEQCASLYVPLAASGRTAHVCICSVNINGSNFSSTCSEMKVLQFFGFTAFSTRTCI